MRATGHRRQFSGPGKHMLNMTMVFEQPGFQCDNDPCSIQSEVLWTDVRSMHRTQPMSSTVANPQLYILLTTSCCTSLATLWVCQTFMQIRQDLRTWSP